MILRLQLLRNIGQFDSVADGAVIPLARLTVVYSENGRGKTTLAAVLRSLATGDPMPIKERRRLAATHAPHIVLELSGGPPPAIFQNDSWNRTLPNLAVFDDVFVDDNVHSGLSVESQHRQNLHELILGAQAVTLSKQHQQLVSTIEAHNRELRARERAVPSDALGPYSIDEFCALQPRTDIEEAVLEAERAFAAAQQHDRVRTAPTLGALSLPSFDRQGIERLLTKDLPALDAATLVRVHEHLSSIGSGGESWVAEGVRRHEDLRERLGVDVCPFCGQATNTSPILNHYRAFFGGEYASLKNDVAGARTAMAEAHGERATSAFERSVRVLVESIRFWSDFCEIPNLAIDTATVTADWNAARDAVISQLRAKQNAPLERIELVGDTSDKLDAFETQLTVIASMNRLIADANRAIEVAKERVATSNAATLLSDLAKLKAVKSRSEPAASAACDDYVAERTSKEATERERDQTRAALEQHRTTVFPGYQTAINLYLARFNAGFRLDNVTYANTRGGPSAVYNVLINNVRVAVDGAAPSAGEPSFRNTLSAGDRNTLALALFFASLDQDQQLAGKVVVIDDPISSLDEHRALTTVQEIRRLAERAVQVIVLSHNKPFQCRLWEGADPQGRAALEIVRDGTGSSLRIWNVALDAVTEHDRRHSQLHAFVANGTGDHRAVATSLRPHVEAFLRVACPNEFRPGTLLGPFRHHCRQRVGTADSVLSAADIQELDEIVEYANRFHHDTNPAWETEHINDLELRGFTERTLRFCRR